MDSAERDRLQGLLARQEVSPTPNQLALWAWNQLEPRHPALVLSSEWTIDSASPDLGDRLRQAFTKLAQRHFSLSTTFARQQGELVVIPWQGEIDFQEIAVDGANLDLLVDQQRKQTFDLEIEPPLRVRYFRSEISRLLVQVHHIASDWWSMLLLVEDLSALLDQRDPEPLEIDFASYARWHSVWLEGDKAQAMIEQWRRELKSPRPDLRFHPERPGSSDFDYDVVPCALPGSLASRLRALAKRLGLSFSTVLLSAYGRALGEHTCFDEVIVALPSSGRWRSSFRNIVGPLYNVLPIRMRVDNSLQQVDKTLERALAKQELPFPTLVQHVNARRSGAFPYTSAALSLIPYHQTWTQMTARDFTARHIPREFLIGPFDLTLNVMDSAQDLKMNLQYSTRAFLPETAEQLSERILKALEATVARSDSTGESRPKTQAERIEERFQETALRHPSKTAVRSAQHCFSYEELNDWSTRLGSWIQTNPADKPVGLWARPSVESVVGWLAILKAGRICMPLDPELPPGRLQTILDDSGCLMVITADFNCPDWTGVKKVPIHQDTWNPASSSTERSEHAYLLYTSGTQGRPTGVLGTHASLLHRIDWMKKAFPWRTEEVALLRTPVGFVDSVAEWFAPLEAGAGLAPYPSSPLLDPDELLSFAQSHQVTRATLVPSLLGMLLKSRTPWPPSLSFCISSGEVLRSDLVRSFYQRAPDGSILLNLYGSTECAGDVTWFDTRQLEDGAATVPLGLPLGATELFVLNQDGEPLPEGEEGEIWVAGPALSAGYWGQPELNEQVFRTSDPPAQKKMLRLGDRGLWQGGLLEFRGREAGQAKIRGWRVELQEIEYVLEGLPDVQEAVALAKDERIDAWVASTNALNHLSVWSHLRHRLASPMLPHAIYCVERIPRFPSGKVDYATLGREKNRPLPPVESSSEPSEAPWRAMAELWQEVLNRPFVGPDDNFFELGGHSMAAVELTSRIERRFGLAVPPGILVEVPTVAGLSALLEQGRTQPVLVRLRGQGPAPRLCLIPGAWGGTIGFHKLVEKFPEGSCVVGMEYDALEMSDRTSLKQVARKFTAELLRYCPQGPYRLCGFSMGGLLAYEMACELGEQMEHLILLDSHGPGIVPHSGVRWKNRLLEMWTHIQILARSRPRHIVDRLAKLPERLNPPASEQFHLALDYLARWQNRPGYEGRCTLIRLSHQPDWMTDSKLGWSEVFPELEMRTIIGLHGALVLEEPVVSLVAKELLELIY